MYTNRNHYSAVEILLFLLHQVTFRQSFSFASVDFRFIFTFDTFWVIFNRISQHMASTRGGGGGVNEDPKSHIPPRILAKSRSRHQFFIDHSQLSNYKSDKLFLQLHACDYSLQSYKICDNNKT